MKGVVSDVCETAFREYAERLGISISELRSHSRTWRLSDYRMKIAKKLHHEGFKLIEIAGVMNRDHTSVRHMLGIHKPKSPLPKKPKIRDVVVIGTPKIVGRLVPGPKLEQDGEPMLRVKLKETGTVMEFPSHLIEPIGGGRF